MEHTINFGHKPLAIENFVNYERANDKRQWLLDCIPDDDPDREQILDIIIEAYETVLETVQSWLDEERPGKVITDLVPDWTLCMLVVCYYSMGDPVKAFNATILSVLPGWDLYSKRRNLPGLSAAKNMTDVFEHCIVSLGAVLGNE